MHKRLKAAVDTWDPMIQSAGGDREQINESKLDDGSSFVENLVPDTPDDGGMIDDRVELSDLTKSKRDMMRSLREYKEQKYTLKSLSIHNEEETKMNMLLIKNQVIELADRFDQMEQAQRQQKIMLGYLVQSIESSLESHNKDGQNQTQKESEMTNKSLKGKVSWNKEDVDPDDQIVEEEEKEDSLNTSSDL